MKNISYEIIKKFEQQNLFLAKRDKKNTNKKYFLKYIEIKDNPDNIYKKLNNFKLEYIEETNNDNNKISLSVLMKATESENYKVFNEIGNIIYEEIEIWKIFISLVIELNSLKSKYIDMNIKSKNIFIDDKNNVKINLIDVIFDDENDEKDIIIQFKNGYNEIKYMNKNQKSIIWSLGLILLHLSVKRFEIRKYSELEIKEFLENNKAFNEIYKNGNILKNIIFKLLCEENERLTLDELILQKDFLYKVIELNLFSDLIKSEKKSAIEFNEFPFSFKCNSCNIIPNMFLLDSKTIIFRCPKCHLLDEENCHQLRNLRNFILRWITSNDICFFMNDNILQIYRNNILGKIDYIYKTIDFMHKITISDDESKIVFFKTMSNILKILFEQMQFGKDLIIFYSSLNYTISKIKNDNEYKSAVQILNYIKNNFAQDEKNKEKINVNNEIISNEDKINNKNFQKGKKDNKIESKNIEYNIFSYNKENAIKSSVHNLFKSLIKNEKEKFEIFSNKLSEMNKSFLLDYINGSFSKKGINEPNINTIYKYIEDSIDFSRILHQYVIIEAIKNPNNFLDIDETLKNFKDYSSTLNSRNHGNFILALLGKFFQINGMKTNILKKKDPNFNNIELCCIQSLFSLGTQRKYEIHFNFGKKENELILKDEKLQNQFLKEYKIKISKILRIDVNRLIFKDVRYGCVQSTLSILEQSSSEDMSISTIYNLENVTAINKKVLVDELLLSPDIFDPKGDRCEGWGINETRGGEKYIPPIGWIGIGLKVLDKYENNDWLSYRNIRGEYSVAYYGLHNFLNDRSEMSENLSDYITDIRNAISERVFQNEDDKRTGFLGLFRKKCSGGVCLFQDPKYAECCAGVIRLLGIEYKILLMCRVNPAKIRQPSEHDKFWVLNPTPDEIRPYRILLKRIDNSPLSLDNKLKIEYGPVYYIINAINSNDYSFYDLKKNRLSEYNPTEIIDEEFQNQIFVIKVYSSIYHVE